MAAKRQITDEIMADHLNAMHISHEYTAHQQTASDDDSNNWTNTISADIDDKATEAAADSATYNSQYISMSNDLEQKLKNARAITICEQISKMKNEPLLPNSLIERLERPCLAVVLWQPPFREAPSTTSSKTDEPVAGPSSAGLSSSKANVKPTSSIHEFDDEDDDVVADDVDFNNYDNNNSSSFDLNQSMDMDM